MKKKLQITLASLMMICSQSMANFSGGDDFNDNSLEGAKWTNFVNEAGTSFSETNGRLEFEAAGVGVDRSNALKWEANAGSYTENWVVTLDTVNQLDENLISNGDEAWLGFMIYFNSFDNGFGIDRNKGNNGSGYHEIVTEGKTNGISLFKEYLPASSDEIAFSISFDATAKTLSSSYDLGSGFTVFTNMDVSAWGMSDGDVFELVVYGGSRGVVVNSGDVYADNLVVSGGDVVPGNLDALIYRASSIVGCWIYGDSTTKDSVMITFMDDGTYFLSHDGIADGGGQPGMERGTYTWNTNTGAFVATTTVDTCGDWGLSHPGGSVTVAVAGDTLIYHPISEGPVELKRVNHPTTPPSIVGGWKHVGYPVPTHDNVAMAFLPNGIYFFAQDGDSTYDPSGQDGMERGVYSWDPDTGAFSAAALTDTCGEWGFSHPGGPQTFTVNGNEMLLNGSFLLERVVDAQSSDVDGDGLPDDWEQQYFSNPTNTAATGHGDGDTLNNRAEYVAGTDPTDENSFFAITNTAPDPSGFVLNWPAVEGRLYSINWAASLTNGLAPLATDIPFPQNSYTDTVHSAEGAGFYQIEVRLDN